MTNVELVYNRDCPNVAAARTCLLRAFAFLQLKPQWQEWEINDPEAPTYVRHAGSPSILVNGKDIDTGRESAEADNCRIYIEENNSISGVPPLEKVIKALRTENRDKHVAETQKLARCLGVKSAIHGVLAECCQDRGVDAATLKAAGVGSP